MTGFYGLTLEAPYRSKGPLWGKLRAIEKVGEKKGRNTFCQNHKVFLLATVPMRLPFRDLITIKQPGDVLVPVEHNAAELLVRQHAFDTEILQGAMRDAEHLPDVGAF